MASLRIAARSGEPLESREAAGRLLGRELGGMRSRNPVVLGIPRGGLIVARAVADALGAPLDAVFAANILSPGHPGLVMGTISENGKLLVDEALVEKLDLWNSLAEEAKAKRAELARRSALIRERRPKIPLRRRTVIVVDDGLFTGSTMKAALRMVGEEAPRELVAAVPVGLEGAVEKAAALADGFVCLRSPPDFIAVSSAYRSFPQVGEEEIVRLFRN